MALETEAIRQAIPDSVIVSVDPPFRAGFLPSDASWELRTAAAFCPASLVYGKVQRRAVKVGPADAADRVQVLEGLAPGDRIVRANLGTLREGTAARLAGPQPEASR